MDINNIPLGQADVIKSKILLDSGNIAETIYFKRPEKQVICISTQISCNIGCLFCASPNKGKTYNLTTEEMIHQVRSMYSYIVDDTPLLISFMGEGEPFANYNATIAAMHFLDDNFTCRISVSTIGLNLRKFAKEEFKSPVKLQVSIHVINASNRKKLMPFAPKFEKVYYDLCYFKENSNIPIDLNFTLVKGINDNYIDRKDIAYFFKDYHIKISKLNPVNGINLLPSLKGYDFVTSLQNLGISAEYHETDGASKLSACGQTSGLLKD